MSIQFRPGLIVLGASLVAAIVKMYALEAAARAKVFHRLKAVLIPAIVFTLSFQPSLALSRGRSHNHRELLSYALWAIYGSLPLLLHFTRPNLGQLSGWKSAGFRRAMLAAALILPGIQLGGQIWVYRAPFSLSYIVPLLISCLVILPDIFKTLSAFEVATFRFLGAAALILGFGLTDGSHWQFMFARHEFVLSAMRLNLAFAGGAFLLMWMRDDQPVQLSVGCVLSVLALMGHDFQSIQGFFFDPDWIMLAASVPIAHLWLRYNRGYWRLLGVATFYIFCAANGLEKRTQFQCCYEAACYWPIIAFALSLLVGLCARNWQMLLLGVIFCIGVVRYPVDDSVSVIYFVAALSSIWAARFILKNNTFIVIAAYYSAAAYMRFGLPQPKSHVNWGWIVIAFAFLVFGAAFLVTRNQVKRMGGQT
jgi:hypothetical protein